jgi:hypothetical protein
MLGMMTLMSSICYASNRTVDSILINRMWNYYEHSEKIVDGEKNVYIKCHISTKRRNALLWVIPTMYSIAKGDRDYIGEAYTKLRHHGASSFDIKRQVFCSTVPHQRDVMPAIYEFITPNLYAVQLYPDGVLSPFHRTNRFFYKYRVTNIGSYATIKFRPRSSNTRLIKGEAIVDIASGRILSLEFQGEYDMISFDVKTLMDQRNPFSPLPDQCTTDATFKFLGNNIKAHVSSYFNCPVTLPDSLNDIEDLTLMEKLRPVPLDEEEKRIVEDFHKETIEEEEADTIQKRSTRLKDAAWDFVGDNLMSSKETQIENVSLNVSPLLNPLYMGYSSSSGISYKLDFGLRYAWNTHRYLTLNPKFGYSFKKKLFYYDVPLRMTYNPKRNGYVEFTWANGDHTSNAALSDAFQKVMGDTVPMPEFKNEYLQLVNHIAAFDWLEFTTGIVYHRRWSIAPDKMDEAGLPNRYHSFAPTLSVHLRPWQKGPTLTANYERSISNIFHSNMNYERWEFDAVYKHQNKSVRILNMRAGAGFYTHRSTDFFVDYSNFHDNNLATGWEDDWSGQFQLVDSRWYNESNYYVRGHVSYDSPLLMLSWVPLVGRIVETERIYLSALSIEHTRPYFEVGYGFQNRYFSTGIFASFLNTSFQSFGCKFTIELFRRW